MSHFDDDGMSGLLEDDQHNQNIIGDDLPSGSDDDEAKAKDNNGQAEAIAVEPKKRAVRNPRPRLTVELLKGPRGIHTIENYFKDIKFAGKGHENRDLNEVMKRLQHWAHRMYPNYSFDDILTNIDRLSKKKPLMIHMNNYRQDLLRPDEGIDEIHSDKEDEAAAEEPFDEFDALISEQIAISKLTATTPGSRTPHSVRSDYSINTNVFTTPYLAKGNAAASTPYQHPNTPRPASPPFSETPSSPAEPPPPSKLTSEQLARIAENRRRALERFRERQAAKAALTEPSTSTAITTTTLSP